MKTEIGKNIGVTSKLIRLGAESELLPVQDKSKIGPVVSIEVTFVSLGRRQRRARASLLPFDVCLLLMM